MNKKIDIDLLDDGSGSHYVKERKVYPRDVSGRFDRLRKLAVFWLLGMYYVFPWLSWDGRQAVLFDLPARKFYVFGLTFWPQDFIFLAMLLVILALVLFFFTALAGRLWCGYACPQTVWTEVFLWMERWTEGDRNKRMKLDAGPWNREKFLRKGSKHLLWLVFALWTGFTFVGFFTPIVDLGARIWPFAWNGWETFWVLFYALATWGNAGFLREQVCKYMCPYARFQSAMFDRNTLIIAYDPMRGEPRGPRKRGLGDVLARGRGLLDKFTAYDYVFRAARHPSAADNACAGARHHHLSTPAASAVEPLPKFPRRATGRLHRLHDLRAGLPDRHRHPQRPAIRMHRLRRLHRRLRRRDGQDGLSARPDPLLHPERDRRQADSRVLRPRVLVYGVAAAGAGRRPGPGASRTRSPLIVEVLRDRNALYRVAADGIDNGYTLKLVNKTDAAQEYRITLEADDCRHRPAPTATPARSKADAEQVLSLPLEVTRAGQRQGPPRDRAS